MASLKNILTIRRVTLGVSIILFIFLVFVLIQPKDIHIPTLDDPNVPANEKAHFAAKGKIIFLGYNPENFNVSTIRNDALWEVTFTPKEANNKNIPIQVIVNDKFEVLDVH